MTPADLNQRLHGSPFRPFKLHLHNGTTYPIREAGTVIVTDSTVMFPVKLGRDERGFPVVKSWTMLGLNQIVRLSDLREPATRQRPKKRGQRPGPKTPKVAGAPARRLYPPGPLR